MTCFTYLIGWSKENKYYYGARYAKSCEPLDLWNTYFTSSKFVKEFREEYGEPDIVQVRKTFNTPAETRKRMSVARLNNPNRFELARHAVRIRTTKLMEA